MSFASRLRQAREQAGFTQQDLAKKLGVTKNAIATAWILRHPAKMQVLLGSMNPERLTQMIQGVDITLDRQEWYDLYLAAGNDLP